MRCVECQDLIITGYIDNELAGNDRRSLAEHLSTCAACREFKDAVVQSAVEPFRGHTPAPVPAYIWTELRNRLAAQPTAPGIRWQQLLSFPRVALVAASLVFVLLAGVWIPARFTAPDPSPREIAAVTSENEEYFDYLETDRDGELVSDAGFGTAAETFMSL